MHKFSNRSKTRLGTCEMDLQELCNEALQIMNLTVLEGHRLTEDQLKKFRAGLSKVKWSKHNETPSEAVDISPWPIPDKWGSAGPDRLFNIKEFKERAKFYYLGGIMMALAYVRGISLRWGGNWDRDYEVDFGDQSFDDLVHFEVTI